MTRPALGLEPTSPEYRKLIDRGYDQLDLAEAKRVEGESQRAQEKFESARARYNEAIAAYDQALRLFKAAEKLPDHPAVALFYQGVTWTREGQAIDDYNMASRVTRFGATCAYCNALKALEHSRARASPDEINPNFHLEMAEALIPLGEHERALQELAQFKAERSQDAGRAKQLRTAAEKEIKSAGDIKPVDVCGKASHPMKIPLVGHEPAKADKKSIWEFAYGFTTGMGYNGNVTSLGRTLPLPAGVNGKGAFFNESALNIEADWYCHHGSESNDLIDKLAISYGAVHDAYDDHSSSNTFAQTGTINYCHALQRDLCMSGQLADTWLRSDTKNISNTLAFQPAVKFWPTRLCSSQVLYNVAWLYFSQRPRRDRVANGSNHRVALEQTWKMPPNRLRWFSSLKITGQFGHEWRLSEGAAASRTREYPLIKAECGVYKASNSCAFLQSVTFAASYEFRHDEYERAPAPTRSNPNPVRRRDDTHVGDFVLTAKMWYDEKLQNRMEAVLDFQTTTADSNLASKAFDQPRLLASLKINF